MQLQQNVKTQLFYCIFHLQNEEIDEERPEQKNFSCQLSFEKNCGTLVICNKTYKTKKGLESHKRMKHQHCPEELINRSILSDLITRSCEKITADKCFPPSTRQASDNFKLTDQEIENIFQEILPITKHHHNLDKYFQHSFSLHSKNQLFGKQIGLRNSALLQLELTKQVLLYIRKDVQPTKQVLLYIRKDVQPTDKEMEANQELTKNELYALQYLAGYIFHKFYKNSSSS